MAGTWRMTFDAAKAKRAVHQAAADGLTEAVRDIGHLSDRRVPVDKGDLEHSQFIHVDRGRLHAEIGYSDEIAAIEHENMYVRHKNGRTAKFLEIPLFGSARKATETIAAHVRRALAR